MSAPSFDKARRAARARRQTDAMTPEQALAARERLGAERDTAQTAVDTAAAEIARLDSAIPELMARREAAFRIRRAAVSPPTSTASTSRSASYAAHAIEPTRPGDPRSRPRWSPPRS